MQEEHDNIRDRAAALLGWLIGLLAWFVALSLAYGVYLKFKFLFH